MGTRGDKSKVVLKIGVESEINMATRGDKSKVKVVGTIGDESKAVAIAGDEG